MQTHTEEDRTEQDIMIRLARSKIKKSKFTLLRTMCTRTKKSNLYTRTGDKGTSSLYNLERRPKDDPVFAALGDTDELNSAIGIAREYCGEDELQERLAIVQSRLLDIGSAVATPPLKSKDNKLERVKFDESHISILESWIDEMDAAVPPLRNFILPSGGLCATHLHLARSVCRRAERHCVALTSTDAVQGSVTRYMNRLSDFLFAAARYSAVQEGRDEVAYKKE